MNRTKVLNSLLIALLVCSMILFITYVLSSNQFPSGDHGDHFRIAIQHNLALEEGLLNFLEYFKAHGGKPILHAVYALPLLVITQNNVLVTTRIFFALTYISLAFSILLFLKQFIKSTVSLGIVALVLTSLRIFSINTQFMPEAVWLPLAIAGLGISTSEIFYPSQKHYLGMTSALILLALSTLARPVESLIVISPLIVSIIATYLAIRVKSKSERWKIFARIFALVLILYIFLAFSIYLKTPGSWFWVYGDIWVVLGQLFLSYFFIRLTIRFLRLSESKVTFHLLAYALKAFIVITSWWFFNYANALYNWAFSNSLGETALRLDQFNAGKNFFQVLLSILIDYKSHGVELAVLALIISLLALRIKCPYLSEIEIAKVKFLCLIIASSILSLVIFTYIYSKTGVSEPRRLMLCISILVISSLSCSALVFEKLSADMSSLFKFTVILATLYNLVLILPNVVVQGSLINIISFSSSHEPHYLKRSFEREYVQKVRDLGIRQSRIVSITPFTIMAQPVGSTYRTFEPEALRYASLVYDDSPERNVYGTCWNFASYEEPEKVFQRILNSDVDYLLMDSISVANINDFSARTSVSAHLHFYRDLIDIIKENGIDGIDELQLVHEFEYSATPVFLFKVNKAVIVSYLESEATCPGVEAEILVEEGFLGFNILQGGFAKFYAIPQGEGSFSRKRFYDGEYSRVFFAQNLRTIKQEIQFSYPRGFSGEQ